MKIQQFKYSHDNLGYLIYGQSEAIAIDGGDTAGILNFLDKRSLKLKVVTNTHSHHDHISGNAELLKQTDALFHDVSQFKETDVIQIEEDQLKVYHTPGHTMDSYLFYTGRELVTGDTLFNGTVGNCFSGDQTSFLKSIKFILPFPKETVIYSGHDYVDESMIYAKIIEPYNTKNQEQFFSHYDKDHVKSTIKDELSANPYLRFNDKDMIENLQNRNLPHKTEIERWSSVMSIG